MSLILMWTLVNIINNDEKVVLSKEKICLSKEEMFFVCFCEMGLWTSFAQIIEAI